MQVTNATRTKITIELPVSDAQSLITALYAGAAAQGALARQVAQDRSDRAQNLAARLGESNLKLRALAEQLAQVEGV